MEMPKDPVMLLSFINMQLRDHFPTFEEFVKAYGCDEQKQAEIIEKLKNIDYEYDEKRNQFI
jgi:hypothetical protein